MIPRRSLVALASAWLWGSLIADPAPAQGAPEEDAEARFDAMLAAAKRDPAKADWTALRRALAETSRYRPYDETRKDKVAAIREGLRGEDPKAAEAALDQMLEREGFLRLDLHRMAAVHYAKAGAREKAELHEKFVQGLLGSLFDSGDGTDFDDSVEVLYVEEEYILLRVMKLKPKLQTQVAHEGRNFDVLDVEAEGGGESKYYFNIDLPWEWLQEAAKEAKKGKAEG